MLDERWLPGLSRLRLASALGPSGSAPSWRPARRAGEGFDFLSHREYMPGDDFRAVDWKALARLDRPYVRVYARETDLPVELALDSSLSMARPDPGKWEFARAVAACLGVVALASGERLRVVPSGASGRAGAPALLQGTQAAALARLVRTLQALEPAGAVEWERWAGELARAAPGPALTLVVSDLLAPVEEVERALQALRASRREVALVHVLGPSESAPLLGGELRLVDVESGRRVDVHVDARLLARYRSLLRDWQERLRAVAHRHGFRYVAVTADGSPYEAVAGRLREAGVVR